LVAGINAVLKIRQKDALILRRDESYIGVLIDDLVTKGVEEPYRMFTARAEFRILLRQDNADERLTEKGFNLGIVERERLETLRKKREMTFEIIELLKNESLRPNEINNFLEKSGTSPIKQKLKAISIALRPQIRIGELLDNIDAKKNLNVFKSERINEILESAEVRIKYDGYIQREKMIADKIKRLEDLRIPEDIVYEELTSISTEGREKLTRIKPANIGQAGRISGVSPADICILLMYLGR